MQTGEILRIVMITAGILIFMQTILSLAKRRLKEQFCLLCIEKLSFYVFILFHSLFI